MLLSQNLLDERKKLKKIKILILMMQMIWDFPNSYYNFNLLKLEMWLIKIAAFLMYCDNVY